MTHTANPFGQVLVALVTPMTADGEVETETCNADVTCPINC
jgi:dihydrodipicolinate synthase/N-acetylneuraminate lyase